MRTCHFTNVCFFVIEAFFAFVIHLENTLT